MSRLAIDIDQFRRRLLEDCLREATADCWRHRAETLEAARHRPGVDYPGQASLGQLRARWVELTAIARACRRKAWLVETGADPVDFAEVVDDVAGEVA